MSARRFEVGCLVLRIELARSLLRTLNYRLSEGVRGFSSLGCSEPSSMTGRQREKEVKGKGCEYNSSTSHARVALVRAVVALPGSKAVSPITQQGT
jgi:hypothetical protein